MSSRPAAYHLQCVCISVGSMYIRARPDLLPDLFVYTSTESIN